MGFIFYSGNYNFAIPVYGIEERGDNEEWWTPMEAVRREQARAAERARMEAARREAAERRRKMMEERRRRLEARREEQDDEEDEEEEREVYLRYVVRILETGGRIRARSVERVTKEDGTETIHVEAAFGSSSEFPADAVAIEDRGPPPEPPEPSQEPAESEESDPDAAEADTMDAADAADDDAPEADTMDAVVESEAPETADSDEPAEAEEPEPAFIVEMLSTGGRLEALEVSREASGESVRIRIRTRRGMTMYVQPDQVRVYRPDGTTLIDPANLP
jgi:hypothetical protein